MAQTQPSRMRSLSLSLSLSLCGRNGSITVIPTLRPPSHLGQTAVCIILEFRYFITHRWPPTGSYVWSLLKTQTARSSGSYRVASCTFLRPRRSEPYIFPNVCTITSECSGSWNKTNWRRENAASCIRGLLALNALLNACEYGVTTVSSLLYWYALKIKVNLFLWLFTLHVITDVWSSEVIASRILKLDASWMWVITSVRGTFTAGTRRLGTNNIEDWADPGPLCWVWRKGKSLQQSTGNCILTTTDP